MILQPCPLLIYEISITSFRICQYFVSVAHIQFPHFQGLPFWCGGATDVGEKGS